MARIFLLTSLASAPVWGAIPWNQNDKLQPPSGGWRGAVVDDTRFSSVSAWEKQYGFPLHMKRIFKANGWQQLSEDETNFVKEGGIILYTIPIKPPLKFTDFIGSAGQSRIKQFADVIKPLSPAKVMVSVRYEPSLWVDPAKPEKFCGTPAEYREMWKSFQDGFKSFGVDNVVWAVDYSTRATTLKYHPELAALWPGDGKVDWLLFNMFQYGADTKRTWLDMFETAYTAFEQLSGVPQTYNGTNYTANYKSALSWGLGAWGADLTSGSEAQRAQFIEDSATYINTSVFPRMKAQVYFDTYDKNTGTGSIIQDGQQAAYRDLNGLSFFTQNDKRNGQSQNIVV